MATAGALRKFVMIATMAAALVGTPNAQSPNGQSGTGQSGTGQAAPFEPPPAPAAAADARFAQWKAMAAQRALAAGYDTDFVARTFASLTPTPQALEQAADANRFVPIWRRLDPLTDSRRIARAGALYHANAGLLRRIERRYGVPGSLLVALWGVETNFGRLSGGFDLLDALATRAALDPSATWRAFGEENFAAALKIVASGRIARSKLRASYAGATGQVQFLPTTYWRYGIDQTGDGLVDLWSSPADALASAAHYLEASGFRRGAPIAYEVSLPAGFDYGLANDVRKSTAEWAKLGVKRMGAATFPSAQSNASAELFVAAGRTGPAFLLYENFEALKVYNRADFYALALWLIAERVKGHPGLSRDWPRQMPTITDAQGLELQEGLASMGFSLTVDGRFGRETRKALQAFQQSRGLPADGFPSPAMLEAVRAARPAPPPPPPPPALPLPPATSKPDTPAPNAASGITNP